MSSIFLEGFLLQAGLIFALGPQNVFVLESGLYRRHHIAVSFTCFLCDFSVIMLGVLGTAALFEQHPEVKVLFGILGIGFLLYYAFEKLRTAQHEVQKEQSSVGHSLRGSVLKAMSFSILNPHAYLDGIVLIGGYSTKYSVLSEKLAVGLGASIYSLVWFLLLSSASSIMMPILNDPRRMRWAMTVSSGLLVFLSFKLGHDVYGWVDEIMSSELPVVLQVER